MRAHAIIIGCNYMRALLFRRVLITLGLAGLVFTTFAQAQPRIYQLERIQLQGTQRISAQQIQDDLDLYPGMKLNDDLVVVIREKLLSLGLFESVLLYMKKGSKPGLAVLHIDIEDDPSVIGTWALGWDIAITSGEPQTAQEEKSTPGYGYKSNVLARNIFTRGYRGSLGLDVDSRGIMREWRTALGLPRFSKESAQFDGQVSSIDVAHRYLNVLGFGQKAEVYWSQDVADASLSYGVSMYLNRDRFAVPGGTKSLVGPRLSYQKESRLLGFIPSKGYGYGAAVMLPVGRSNHFVLELNGGKTHNLNRNLITTLEGRAMAVGTKGYSTRVDWRFDVPVGRTGKTVEYAKMFLLLQMGKDHYETYNLDGNAVSLGLRYHSPGFIAEVGLKVSRIPDELNPRLNTGDFHD